MMIIENRENKIYTSLYKREGGLDWIKFALDLDGRKSCLLVCRLFHSNFCSIINESYLHDILLLLLMCLYRCIFI